MHPLLARQLKKCGLAGPDVAPPLDAWETLLGHVNRSYEQADQERYLRSHSQELADKEMQELSLSLAAARDQALESARIKAEFMATMSHELRTPLNGVIGMVELLLDTELNHEQREYASTLRSSAESLLAIISDILDFSKIEAGKLELERTDFDLRRLVEEVGEMLRVKAQEKQLELMVVIKPNVPRKLRGDPNRLRQVLLNLVNNAIKFTAHGEVLLRVDLLEQDDDRARFRFNVVDTGIGIPKARMHRLFQSFSQVDASTTRRFGGTGLGLAISKELVERMGGSIDVESEEGRGSTFGFELTIERTPMADLDDPTAELHFNGLRVMIVDDNATNRTLFTNILRSSGCETEEASSGSEALELLERAAEAGAPYSLAIVDFQMPGMNGAQFATLVRANRTIASTQMILATSIPKAEVKDQNHDGLFTAVLTKPVKYAQLRDAVAKVAAQTAPVRQRAHAPVSKAAPAECRILVVEDNPVNQMVATRLLARRGYTCDVAFNGVEAVAAHSARDYDAILMDCQMPEMDGYEATRQIRLREGSDRRTLVVAMTADALPGDRERCLSAQMDDYLSKPVRPAELFAILDRHLSESAKETPST